MKFILTGPFGELAQIRGYKPHTGIDMRMPENSVLRALDNGVIEKVIFNGEKIGNGVVIRLENGMRATYGHLNKITVEKGQKIIGGQEIGLSGNTGNSSAPHLHFSLQDPKTGEFLDPTPLGEKIAAMSGGDGGFLKEIGGKTYFDFKGFFKERGQVNQYKDAPEHSAPMQWFLDSMHDLGVEFWQWFIVNLPDIIGYTAMGAGIIIILSAMGGRGIIKPIGWFFGAFIVAASILGGAK